MKMLEKVSNVAVIIGVTVVLLMIVRGELARHKPPVITAKGLVGKTIKLPGVSFPQERSSLVLALSTTCHFCKESLPFYKELVSKSQGQLNVVALMPQPEPEMEKYLEEASMPATHIISASLDSIAVAATPTLLLVDKGGTVQDAWIGLLDHKRQQQVLSRVLSQLPSQTSKPTLSN